MDSSTQISALIRGRSLRRGRRLEIAGDRATLTLALVFPVAAVPLALWTDSARHASLAVVALYVGVYALASLVQFEIGGRAAVPTQLVFVPMLFVLPTGWVPLAAAAGLLLGDLARRAVRSGAVRGPSQILASSWPAMGPALVLLLAGEGPPSWSRWPIYVLALAAQLAFDAAATAICQAPAHRSVVAAGLVAIAAGFAVDAACSPAGLAFAMPAAQSPEAILIAAPLLALAAFFARDRAARIQGLLELSETYRGTAAMLGDVIEADDAYTADHSRCVVNLSLAVADALQLDAGVQREVEFTALLHDVGKLRMPKQLITKAGPLTADERALMETHTLEGHALLSRGGGFLARIGALVRSCHERFDGTGYPDRLAGSHIPLPARIVSCCDAFDAMTSDRPYRRALPREVALDELRRGAGTHFDPTIAAALVRIIEGDQLAARDDDALPRPADSLAGGVAARAVGSDENTALPEPRTDRERLHARSTVAPAAAAYIGGGLFAVIALTMVLLHPSALTPTDLGLFAAFATAYAVAYGIEFEVGPGSAVPTQLVFVPMLAFLPLSLIPLAVGTGILASGFWNPDAGHGPRAQRPFVLLHGGWYTLGPVAVLAASGNAPLTWSTLLIVLAVQIVIDAAVNIVRVRFVLGFPLRPLVFSLAWAYLTDIALTPVAYTAVFPVGRGAAIFSVLLLIGFLGMLAGDRKRHLEQTSSLTDAYREASARARRDPLTGLGNRLAWDEALRGIGEGRRAAVILADVNGLKAANDSRGHAFGDAVLTEVAALLRKAAPHATAIARLGGDEFGILLTDDHAEGHRVATRYLRSLFAMHPGVEGAPISAAVGSQSTPPLPDIATVIERADAAVYADKATLARAV
jgi:diguanylate cyclase (GGDEF)-like protein